MSNYLDSVSEFHKTFQAPILESPQIPSKERCNLRISLMQEELNEIKEAIENDDLIEISDGLCDLMYVLCGSILEFGLKDKFDELFDEVQRSNMSKACGSLQEALATLSHYKQKDGTEGRYEELNGKYIVYRSADNKILKSVGYSPASLSQILSEENKK
jgi:predicted HAD superfamily Cof-like phosphohydrolase